MGALGAPPWIPDGSPMDAGEAGLADWHLWLPPALTRARFRVYAAGQTVVVVGGWIQQVALSWLVFRLTNSSFLLGLAGFLLNIFYLLLGPIAGLAADRLPRLRTLIAIEIALAVLAALLAAMSAHGVTVIGAYLVLATLIGLCNAFEMPIRQTLIREIVGDRALIPSAIGVSALIFNVGRIVGPAIAGVMLIYVSEAWCFLLNAVSYGGIIAALLAMRLPREASPAAAVRAQGLREGLAVLTSFPAVRYLLPTVVAVGLFATPYVPLMPSLVAEFFDGRSSTLGLLMAASGVGAVVSSTYLALQPAYGRQLRLVAVAPVGVGLLLVALAWSRALSLSCVLLAAMGASILIAVNTTNALLQQSAPDAWRGRVIGIYSMAFAGTAPIGGLLAGSLAEHIGLRATLTLNGLLILAAGLLGRWRLHNHPEALRGLMRSLVR
jgi:MFS family permease